MTTRGLIGFIWNELDVNHNKKYAFFPKDKLNSFVAISVHKGSYPQTLGSNICQLIKKINKSGEWNKFKNNLKSITVVDNHKEQASSKQIKQYKQFALQNRKDLSNWNALLGGIQGTETLEHILEGNLHHIIDASAKIYHSESAYAYILNLDKMILELYQNGNGIISKNYFKIEEMIEIAKDIRREEYEIIKSENDPQDEFNEFVKEQMKKPAYFGFIGAYSFDKLPQKIEDIPNWDKSEAELREMYEEDLIKEFEKETEKNAIWRGEITKQYLKWRDKKKNEPTIIQKLTKNGNTKQNTKKHKGDKEDVFEFSSGKRSKSKSKKEAPLKEYYDDITEDFLAIMRLYLMKEGIEPTEANLWKALDIFFKESDEFK